MTTNNIIPVKYVFLDVVAYTKRTIEAQCYIIEALNRIVKGTINRYHISNDSVIYIPTGDGMCIALLGIDLPYDIHVIIAQEILRRVQAHNSRVKYNWRKFEVRIGINQSDDNIVTDVNGTKNVAGAGINNARRIMDLADESQILVSSIVYENLHPRKKYYHAFSQEFRTEVKHGLVLKIHQLIRKDTAGLNVNPPSIVMPVSKPQELEPKLDRHLAYYFAYLIKNEKFIVDSMKQHVSNAWLLKLLFWLKAKQSAKAAEQSPYDFYDYNIMPGTGSDILEGQLEWLDKNIPSQVAMEINHLIDEFISNRTYSHYLETQAFDVVVKSEGREKLKRDWTEIWDEFGLDEVSG